jgi:hypothetical protein
MARTLSPGSARTAYASSFAWLPEDLLRPVYGELLDHVHELAAAVVALARVALGVLVRHHRALGCEHRRGGKVLARYQLDGRPLAFELPVERLLDRRIYNLGVRT